MSDLGEQLRLDDAKHLLHVARDRDHIDPQTNYLSKSRLTLEQLKGGPDRHGARRSISTLMMCNQDSATLIAIATRLSRNPDFQTSPHGAAAALGDIQAIDVGDRPAFTIEPEEVEDQPGHVSVRFSQHVLGLSETIQRDLRISLIRVFGVVTLIAGLRVSRC